MDTTELQRLLEAIASVNGHDDAAAWAQAVLDKFNAPSEAAAEPQETA